MNYKLQLPDPSNVSECVIGGDQKKKWSVVPSCLPFADAADKGHLFWNNACYQPLHHQISLDAWNQGKKSAHALIYGPLSVVPIEWQMKRNIFHLHSRLELRQVDVSELSPLKQAMLVERERDLALLEEVDVCVQTIMRVEVELASLQCEWQSYQHSRRMCYDAEVKAKKKGIALDVLSAAVRVVEESDEEKGRMLSRKRARRIRAEDDESESESEGEGVVELDNQLTKFNNILVGRHVAKWRVQEASLPGVEEVPKKKRPRELQGELQAPKGRDRRRQSRRRRKGRRGRR